MPEKYKRAILDAYQPINKEGQTKITREYLRATAYARDWFLVDVGRRPAFVEFHDRAWGI